MSNPHTAAPHTAAIPESFEMTTEVVDESVLERTVERFRANGIALPTFAQLRDPSTIPATVFEALAAVDKNGAHPLNLFRVHWFNQLDGSGPTEVPDHVELPSELTGVDARIVLAFGNRFPMIGAHKVLAAYACLVPRVITGRFDPTANRAVWPSTGNYARGGVAISRIMGCRGVAVLPEGMSRERFDWLDRWVEHPDDIIRTPGTESNVKEIYDECGRLSQVPENVILNQFSEMSNNLGHYQVTGPALAHVYEAVTANSGGTRLAAFVSASGSAGTLGAGDFLKDEHGARIVAVEALECPTLLYNGFGEHNIQGIGDKHVPLIHNVTNTDLVVAISDRATDSLDVLFNNPAGRDHLVNRVGLAPELVDQLVHMGYSSICNTLAAIKTARHYRLTSDDVIVTVATDGSEMYNSERERVLERDFAGQFGAVEAAAVHAQYLEAVDTSDLRELDAVERDRLFNLGYFTWVEQQGVALADFEIRRRQTFWDSLRPLTARWDELIGEFNARSGMVAGQPAP
ncbi:MAG: pyridoxal-phosphate dependent enzyme [Actinomycetia bacterium]|nr:pyridoxal-phosphate dependent enzyme [Actinomycetes bacterium]